MEEAIQGTVYAAQNGSKEALETVIGYAQGYVYNLALRMLQRPADAEDATQEILIKLITHLGQFRGDSAFSTWMYRIATNTLLNIRQRDTERSRLSFDAMSLRLEESLARYDTSPEEAYERAELVQEVKRHCTLGMLMCLNQDDRLALILSEVLEIDSVEAAIIMEVSPAAYRKRLSRARQTLLAFVSQQCGIVNPENPCRCHKHVRNKLQAGLLTPDTLAYAQADDAVSAFNDLRARQPELDALVRTIALLRTHPAYSPSVDYRALLNTVFSASNPDI
ncbi:MAG: RNA polymerase sigma factor [Armatimonadetes bacterium]|nr:RNA polymerase sigma factor [Anaerolineae bacterium]